MTPTHSSRSDQQQAEKSADMGNISIGHERSQRIGPGLEPMLLNIPQNHQISVFFPLTGLFVLPEMILALDFWSAEIPSGSKAKQAVMSIMVENVHIPGVKWGVFERTCSFSTDYSH